MVFYHFSNSIIQLNAPKKPFYVNWNILKTEKKPIMPHQ